MQARNVILISIQRYLLLRACVFIDEEKIHLGMVTQKSFPIVPIHGFTGKKYTQSEHCVYIGCHTHHHQ